MLSLLLTGLLTLGLDTIPPDGPYLFYEGDTVVARWANTEKHTVGQTVFSAEHYGELPEFVSFRPELVDIRRPFERKTRLHYDGVKQVAALSDIHGQFDTGRRLLEVQGIIDENMHWAFGEGHLVIVGDIFDRGDQVTELLWLIHNLELEAEAAGGKVHFLLGNHETLILEGDARYLNAKYRTTSGLTGKFYQELYGRDTYLGRWLRSLPLVVQINETVYIHGGLSRKMVREVKNIARINDRFRRLVDGICFGADTSICTIPAADRTDRLRERLHQRPTANVGPIEAGPRIGRRPLLSCGNSQEPHRRKHPWMAAPRYG